MDRRKLCGADLKSEIYYQPRTELLKSDDHMVKRKKNRASAPDNEGPVPELKEACKKLNPVKICEGGASAKKTRYIQSEPSELRTEQNCQGQFQQEWVSKINNQTVQNNAKSQEKLTNDKSRTSVRRSTWVRMRKPH
ncbi:hypothetical protein GWI33_005823 [Rhynchophorus ferrugineus]|uniref:Uncharacterized protein n=1 Tax=Rhynchophorus ferrugineus TaxID=354439 RepID=A0A834MDE8_RHYFE|nr:hypothetical protein GWI33_005823 [Rhynchophorus ferrugineus]